MPLDAVYRYFETYRKDSSDFEVYSAKGCEPSEADIQRFEEQIGFRLPEEFREFSKSYLGGIYMAAKAAIWPRPKAGDVGPFWSFLYGLIVFGFAEEAPNEIRIQHQIEEFTSNFGTRSLVPFMRQIGNADCFCFDKTGQVFDFSHEDPDNPRLQETSFSDLLMQEIRALEERTHRKKTGSLPDK